VRKHIGRLARVALLTGGLATAIAIPSVVGTPLFPTSSSSDASLAARVALAAPAFDNDNNDDPTNDNSDERNLEGQVLEIRTDKSPPEALVGTLDENVVARLYNDQLHNSGMQVGDYVQMQGEFGEFNIFDAYQVNVVDHGSDNGNDND
jgi:hypothetical protein